jgi:hypothetical protein
VIIFYHEGHKEYHEGHKGKNFVLFVLKYSTTKDAKNITKDTKEKKLRALCVEMFYHEGHKEYHEEQKEKNFVTFVKSLRALRVKLFTTK